MKMKSRQLRKKLAVGQYEELGFLLTFKLSSSLTEKGIRTFLDHFTSQALAQLGLEFNGEGQYLWQGVVGLVQGGDVSDEQRILLARWLENQDEVVEVEAEELEDISYYL
jgi:uncharacterized protein YggL (DUF469 family)